MEELVVVDGDDLRQMMDFLALIVKDRGHVQRVRFAIADGGVKIRINEEPWTPGYGRVRAVRTGGDRIEEHATEAAIIGSGALAWPWWQSITFGYEFSATALAPQGWRVTLRCGDDNETAVEKSIGHADIVAAMRRITDGILGGDKTRHDCVLMLSGDPDGADFDADTADQVLQVAVLGEIRYG